MNPACNFCNNTNDVCCSEAVRADNKATKPSNFNKPESKPVNMDLRYEWIRQAVERIQGERQKQVIFEWQ